MTMGIAPKLSLTENMIADKLSWKKFLQKRYAGSTARLSSSYGEEMVDQYQVLCKSQDVSIDSLSGGNIQKVVLARELSG